MATNMYVFASFNRPDNKTDTISRAVRILSFKFTKDVYTPYTQLSAVFSTETTAFTHFGLPSEYSKVIFYVDSYPVHVGIIDSFKIVKENGMEKGIVTSRGFTSLLLENQLKPGLYQNISVNNLMELYNIPEVDYEKSSSQRDVFVDTSHSSVWDVLVSLSYMIHGSYPYIKGQNKVMMTAGSPEKRLEFDETTLLGYGTEMNTKKLVSSFHMANPDGEYGEYDYENPSANTYITRNVYENFDKRFLYDKEKVVPFYKALSTQGFMRNFCIYNGYKREDLYDTVSFGNVKNGVIKSIKITGDRTGIRTELSIFEENL